MEAERDSGITAIPHQLVPDDYFQKLEPCEVFGDGKKFEVDLGCGDGGFVTQMAERFPERNFLAVERLMGRVKKVCRKAGRMGFGNLKVLRLECAYTVGWLLPDAGVSRLHLLCPDPWPKKRHHRRRIVLDEDFQNGLRRVLAKGGEFLFKTDHAEYFAEAEEAIGGLDGLERVDWEVGEFFYPLTDFEKQWLEEGREIQRARWVRR